MPTEIHDQIEECFAFIDKLERNNNFTRKESECMATIHDVLCRYTRLLRGINKILDGEKPLQKQRL